MDITRVSKLTLAEIVDDIKDKIITFIDKNPYYLCKIESWKNDRNIIKEYNLFTLYNCFKINLRFAAGSYKVSGILSQNLTCWQAIKPDKYPNIDGISKIIEFNAYAYIGFSDVLSIFYTEWCQPFYNAASAEDLDKFYTFDGTPEVLNLVGTFSKKIPEIQDLINKLLSNRKNHISKLYSSLPRSIMSRENKDQVLRRAISTYEQQKETFKKSLPKNADKFYKILLKFMQSNFKNYRVSCKQYILDYFVNYFENAFMLYDYKIKEFKKKLMEGNTSDQDLNSLTNILSHCEENNNLNSNIITGFYPILRITEYHVKDLSAKNEIQELSELYTNSWSKEMKILHPDEETGNSNPDEETENVQDRYLSLKAELVKSPYYKQLSLPYLELN